VFVNLPFHPMTLASFSIAAGLLCYLFGFPMIFAEDQAIAWRRKLLKDEVVVRLLGAFLAVIAGMALRTQWMVTADGEGIIVFIAWIQLIKGAYLAWWPNKYAELIAWDEEKFHAPVWQVLHGILMIFAGAFLTYLGIIVMH
jgi:hypothetical protein